MELRIRLCLDPSQLRFEVLKLNFNFVKLYEKNLSISVHNSFLQLKMVSFLHLLKDHGNKNILTKKISEYFRTIFLSCSYTW
jgi:hypothetical protein